MGSAHTEAEAFTRTMRCPVCGHEMQTECIGRLLCGPHWDGNGFIGPPVVMREIYSNEARFHND